jgi:hypothetical protein
MPRIVCVGVWCVVLWHLATILGTEVLGVDFERGVVDPTAALAHDRSKDADDDGVRRKVVLGRQVQQKVPCAPSPPPHETHSECDPSHDLCRVR